VSLEARKAGVENADGGETRAMYLKILKKPYKTRDSKCKKQPLPFWIG